MKLCVVGQGPSAKGRGREIDACDFVVRMKAFWRCGAEDAGEKIDAWAWLGGDAKVTADPPPRLLCEQWLTYCPQQMKAHEKRGELFTAATKGRVVRQLTGEAWSRMKRYLKSDPSTGFVTVAMAMTAFSPEVLVLVGFDSTTPEKPNYYDARHKWPTIAGHQFDREKQALAGIHDGTWLGEPTATTLEWIGEPNHAE